MYFSEGRERGKVYVYALREVCGSTAGESRGCRRGWGVQALPQELCPLLSPPQGRSRLRSPTSFHQTSQGTAAWPKGNRAWQRLSVVAAARLKEDLSVFLVYKQSQGVCSLPAKGVQPALEQSHLGSRLCCSRPGELPSPEEVMYRVQGEVLLLPAPRKRGTGCKWGLCNMGFSIHFASPKTVPSKGTLLPRVVGCDKVGPSTTSGHRRNTCHPCPLPSCPAALWGRTSFPTTLKSGSKCNF